MVRAPLLDRDGIQGAQERGLAAAENPSDRPREGGAAPAGAGGGTADARRGQPGRGRSGAEKSPSALRSPPKAASERNRIVGALRLGLAALSRLLAKGRMWRGVRLLPEPWPPPPYGLKVVSTPKPQTYPCKPVKGERICRSRFVLDFGRLTWLQSSGFPLSREWRGWKSGMTGARRRRQSGIIIAASAQTGARRRAKDD